MLFYNIELLSQLYDLIKANNTKENAHYYHLVDLLKEDFVNLLRTESPSTKSKDQLTTSKKLKINSKEYEINEENGKYEIIQQEYLLNDDFILLSVELSSDLKINELIAAELLLSVESFKANSDGGHNSVLPLSNLNIAKIIYFKRMEFLLQIMSYFLNIKDEKIFQILYAGENNQSNYQVMIQNVLESFKLVESQLNDLFENINQLRILNSDLLNSIDFKTDLNFKRNNWFRLHQLVGEVFHSIINANFYLKDNIKNCDITFDLFKTFMNHLDENYSANDIFIINYLSGLFCFAAVITKHQDYNKFVIELFDYINNHFKENNQPTNGGSQKDPLIDLLYKPFKCVIFLIFLTFMSNWLYQDWFSVDEQDSNFSNYFENIQVIILKLIRIGSFEELMIISEIVSPNHYTQPLIDGQSDGENFYDAKSLLQSHLPNLIFKRLLDVDLLKTKELTELITENDINQKDVKIYLPSTLNLKFNKNIKLLLNDFINKFIKLFINNFSNILMKICDYEEDCYLTNFPNSNSSTLNSLDNLIRYSDLECFYMLLYYSFTKDDFQQINYGDNLYGDADLLIGFLEWGLTKNTNLLMRSCFFKMLTATTKNGEASTEDTFSLLGFLQSNSNFNGNHNGSYNVSNDHSNTLSLTNTMSPSHNSNEIISFGELVTPKELTSSSTTTVSLVPASSSGAIATKNPLDGLLYILKRYNSSLSHIYMRLIKKFQNNYNNLFSLSSLTAATNSSTIGGSTLSVIGNSLKNGSTNLVGSTAAGSTAAISGSVDSNATHYVDGENSEQINKALTLEDLEFNELEVIEISSYLELIYCVSKELVSEGNSKIISDNETEDSISSYEQPFNAIEVINLLFDFMTNLTNSCSLKLTIKSKIPHFNITRNSGKNASNEITNQNECFLISLILKTLNGLSGLETQKFQSEIRKFQSVTIQNVDIKNYILQKLDIFIFDNSLNNNTNSNKSHSTFNKKSFFLSSTVMPDSIKNMKDTSTTNNSETRTKPFQYVGSSVNSKNNVYFNNIFLTFENVDNFLKLFYKLINDNLPSTIIEFFKRMGEFTHTSRKRRVGIWSYFEYILNDVFVDLNNLDKHRKNQLLVTILKIINSSLGFINPDLLFLNRSITDINNISEADIDANNNPCIIVLIYLYNMKRVRNVIFDCISISNDSIADKDSADEYGDVLVVYLSLQIIDQVLKLDNFFLNIVVPHIKDSGNTIDKSNSSSFKFINNNFNFLCLQSFFNFVSYPSISHFALYVNNPIIEIASTSLDLLTQISNHFRATEVASSLSFIHKNLINSDKLLTIFQTIDESQRIKFAFIDQFESSFDTAASISGCTSRPSLFLNTMSLKLKILKFIYISLSTISCKEYEFTLGHLLLGFSNEEKTRYMHRESLNLGSESEMGTILSIKSLFKSLVQTYKVCQSEIAQSTTKISISALKFSCMILSIIIKVCNKDVLRYLETQDVNLFDDLIKNEIMINNTSCDNDEGCLLLCLLHRIEVLKFLKLKLKHESSLAALNDNISKLLTNFKFLQFLDITHVKISNMNVENDESYINNEIHNLRYLKEFDNISLKNVLTINEDIKEIYNIEHLDEYLESYKIKHFGNLTADDKKKIDNEKLIIIDYLYQEQIKKDSSENIYKALNKWCDLTEFITLNLNKENQYEIILVTFNNILPMINNFYNINYKVSGILIEFCIQLFDIYVKITQENSLNKLFQTCLNGILNNNIDYELRFSLYLLLIKYLNWSSSDAINFNNFKPILNNLLKIIIKDIINNDSNKLIGLILLEKLLKFPIFISLLISANDTGNNNNLLFGYILDSLKKIDDLVVPRGNIPNITLNSFLFELTFFKSILYFLVKFCQYKSGSSYLLQNFNLFKILQNLKILKVDPDLGLKLLITYDADESLTLRMNLDTPLIMGNVALSDNSDIGRSTEISIFELFIPVFQLVVTLLISTGPSYPILIENIKGLLQYSSKLFIGILKREQLLIENRAPDKKDTIKREESELHELSELFLLLSSLTNYRGEY